MFDLWKKKMDIKCYWTDTSWISDWLHDYNLRYTIPRWT